MPGMPRSAAMRPVTLPMPATKTARRSGDVDARVILDACEKELLTHSSRRSKWATTRWARWFPA